MHEVAASAATSWDWPAQHRTSSKRSVRLLKRDNPSQVSAVGSAGLVLQQETWTRHTKASAETPAVRPKLCKRPVVASARYNHTSSVVRLSPLSKNGAFQPSFAMMRSTRPTCSWPTSSGPSNSKKSAHKLSTSDEGNVLQPSWAAWKTPSKQPTPPDASCGFACNCCIKLWALRNSLSNSNTVAGDILCTSSASLSAAFESSSVNVSTTVGSGTDKRAHGLRSQAGRAANSDQHPEANSCWEMLESAM
mmetsp:Transcript_17657/g.48519  ORF Transcript_17657/g.48519 Transcript_17657/m.48519 type:complete len:249 (-) Transcript_17657:184-930(-)